jgi:hypothetical protein
MLCRKQRIYLHYVLLLHDRRFENKSVIDSAAAVASSSNDALARGIAVRSITTGADNSAKLPNDLVQFQPDMVYMRYTSPDFQEVTFCSITGGVIVPVVT